MESTLTAFITLFLVLQAASVRAGKISMVSDGLILTERGGKKHDWENSVTDDGVRGIPIFTWNQPHCVSLTDCRRFHCSVISVRITSLPHHIYLLD